MIIYFNKTINPEPLVYCCSMCGKYFLEKEANFLKTEIKTTHDINYGVSGICSNNCFKELDEILRNLDAGKY